MKNLEQMQRKLVVTRKKRETIIADIDRLDEKKRAVISGNSERIESEIPPLYNSQYWTIRRLEEELDNFVKPWERERVYNKQEADSAARKVSKSYVMSYVPTPKAMDHDRRATVAVKLDMGTPLVIKYRRELYRIYRDAVAFAEEQIGKKTTAIQNEIDRINKETEAKIAQIRKECGDSDAQANRTCIQETRKLVAELEKIDDSDHMRQIYYQAENLHKHLFSIRANWTAYANPKEMPEDFFLGGIQVRLPVRPNKKQKVQDFGVETWAGRDNESFQDLPCYIPAQQSCLLILSSDTSASVTNSPDKILARKILCQMLKVLPPRKVAWSVLDPAHKGASLGRLIDLTDTGSMELNFRVFTDKNSCTEEQKRLQHRPQEIILAMAGRCSSLYEYNKTNPNSPYPLVWYTDFGFTGKEGEKDPVRGLLTTAQAGGTSFLFTTTSEGAEALKTLAKECARTLPVVHIDCNHNTLYLNEYTGNRFWNMDGPDDKQMDEFVNVLKKRFTMDLRQETAFVPTMLKHKRIALRPATTALSIPCAMGGSGDLVDLCLDGKEDSHAYICGKAGSGKSTLLHTLILGACLQYAPGDLELWLADFKMDELRHYHSYYMPQITLVAAGQDPDLSYSLVDRIAAELQRRSTMFARFPMVNNLDEYRKHAGKQGYEKIPVLLIVIDEFHVMSKALAKDPEYKGKLEEIFRQSRSKGIRLVLADQTYGLQGLTQDALKQIAIRIAMQNTLSEIKDTLNAEGYTYTDAMLKTLATLTPGDMVLRRYVHTSQGREPRLEKYRGLYTTLKDVQTLVPQMQKMMSRRIKLKPPAFVDEAGEKRTGWNPQDMLEMDALESVPDYGVRLYLGRGYTLNPCFAVDLGREAQQNLSIVGGKKLFQRWEVVRSVLLSCRRNGYTPLVFLPQGSNLRAGEKYLRELCNQIPGARLMETYGQWCDELLSLKKRMKNLEDTGETVCLFLNLELAAEDMKEFPEWTGENTGGPADTSVLGRLSMYSGSVSQSQQTQKTFNAMPLIRQILKSGYRSNLYSVVEMGTAAAFGEVFRERELFQHRIAFHMSPESMSAYIGSRQDHNKIGEHAVYYGGGSTVFKLLPYQAPEIW